MRIAIGSDHGGFDQKSQLADYMRSLGHEVDDFGPATDDSCDYADYADPVARAVSSGSADRGVLICGTGLGMALTADKVAGVRAAAIETPAYAELFRQHNNGNVLCLSGRFHTVEENEELIRIFLETEFEGGRHARRVEKIMREDDPAFGGVE